MIASLSMYDFPHIEAENQRLWQIIGDAFRQAGIDAPNTLTPGEDWLAPDLLFAQTCGLPYRAYVHPHVALLGTPDYGLTDTAPGYYYSHLIVRAADER